MNLLLGRTTMLNQSKFSPAAELSCGTHAKGVVHVVALFKAADRQPQRSREIAAGKLRIAYAAAEDRALFAEQMIGIVSHDLRNPLSAIGMAAEMLSRRDHDPKTMQMLGHIRHSAARAQRLVADLLDFTLVQVGRGITVVCAPLSFHEVVADCLEENRLSFPTSNLVHTHSGMGAFSADSDRLYQLVGNLVANAIAYGAEGSTVTVSTYIENDTVTLSVHNLGTPIPAALLNNLFEPMIRGSHDNAGLRSVGLGLFIVREIVRAHYGEITVSSTTALGTRFIATFPRLGTKP
ncbi:sensor histidine kinase [Pseudomonas putida]|uniref:sensor histidine kinase n=1 Tax=Pseudomonas putida TaxID=303 RepID=UPI002365E6A5|nr:HAMP domain-containing sensor histidine kinase [Pseudomonas putida]MDD2046608.1 HAMP domain-containing histidine kinase [Pseudomonas putida]